MLFKHILNNHEPLNCAVPSFVEWLSVFANVFDIIADFGIFPPLKKGKKRTTTRPFRIALNFYHFEGYHFGGKHKFGFCGWNNGGLWQWGTHLDLQLHNVTKPMHQTFFKHQRHHYCHCDCDTVSGRILVWNMDIYG